MHKIHIRPISLDDVYPINELRRIKGVQENILGIGSERLMQTEDFIKNLTHHDHLFVAEIEKEGQKIVIGVVGIHLNSIPRLRHSAEIGLMVHPDYQNQKIGRQLVTTVLDLADQWLKLVRIQLEVFIDNQPAIQLYQSLGFVIEGTCKYAAIQYGNTMTLI